jgi:PKD repeat protein
MKTKHLFILQLAFAMFFNVTKAQFGNVWIFANSNSIDFNLGFPNSLNFTSSFNAHEGCAVLCDSLGQLLCYTNGTKIFNRFHQIISNGDSINGSIYSSQNSLFLAKPGSPKIIYLFTTGRPPTDTLGLQYTIIDLTLNGGLGEVIQKNVPVISTIEEKLTATRKCNGIDWWIMVKNLITRNFQAYELTNLGLNTTPVISQAADVSNYPDWEPLDPGGVYGDLKFSPNGKWLLNINSENGPELYSFNSQTGEVDSLVYQNTFNDSINFYSGSFSKESNVFFVSASSYNPLLPYPYSSYLNCYKIQDQSGSINVENLSINNSPIGSPRGLQLGPDGKVYLFYAPFPLPQFNSVIKPIIRNYSTSSGYTLSTDSVLFTTPNTKVLPNFYDGIFTNHHKAALKIPLCNPTGGFDSIPFFDSLLTTTHPYHWNFGDPASGAANESTEQFPVHYFTGPGVYTVTLSLESDCTPLQITQQVTVTQQTPLQPQISNTLGTLECTPAFSYQWYMNGMLISGATLQQFTPSQVGNYWVVISDASGCNAQSEPYGYWILGQVAQAQNNFLRIYPNPASEFVFMDASDHGNWMLYDISGKLCLTGHANKGPNRIILKDLQKGMYVLRAGEKVARLVVE